MSARTFITLLATVVLLAGLMGLFWMVRIPSPSDPDERLICGIGLVRSPSFEQRLANELAKPATDSTAVGALAGPGLYESACEEQTAQRRLWAWPATVLGGVVLLGALVVREREPASA